MSLMHDFAAEDIKAPSFDRPADADTAGLAVSDGTRVVLSYQGKELTAQVTAVERLGAAFVGRVLGFRAEPPGDDLAPGDAVRFRLKDVLWTE